MHKLPEGQVANLLKGLRVAVGNSLDSFDSQQTTSLWRIKNFSGSAKGLSEVYTCILENANVTSSNSVLAGGAVRELILKVLVPPMTDLVDVYGQSGTGSVGIDSSTQEHCVSAKTLFLLSMFVSSRVLHRRCLLLMPPKSARKARIFTLDVEINFLVADESGVISYSKASEFFLPLQRGSLKMSTFLRKLLQSSVIGNGLHLPSMIYIINTIAIQSLVDLDRRICALKFLIGKVESKKYTKVLRSLEKEGAKLVYIVLQDLDAIKNEATSLTSVKWNRVLTSLDFSMIHVARYIVLSSHCLTHFEILRCLQLGLRISLLIILVLLVYFGSSYGSFSFVAINLSLVKCRILVEILSSVLRITGLFYFSTKICVSNDLDYHIPLDQQAPTLYKIGGLCTFPSLDSYFLLVGICNDI